MSQDKRRRFSVEFKLAAIARMEAGESASALARELAIKRTLLYRWRTAWRSGGAQVLLSGPGRPSRAQARVLAIARSANEAGSGKASAERRIAELERKIGQQALDLDFFRQALRHIEASTPSSDRPGATASSPASKR